MFALGPSNMHIRAVKVAWLSLICVLCYAGASRAANRSDSIVFDNNWISSSDYRYIALDQIQQQIFLAWPSLDRIDVLATSDYHLIHSIAVPSPSSVDISPDGTTLAVATSSAHILFFSTSTYAKTNDLVFPESALGVSAFVYTANGNAIIRADEGLSTGGGITVYWNHSTNAFIGEPNALAGSGAQSGTYQTTGPIARSGDYTRIMLGDATSAGVVQVIDGNTGNILQQFSFFGAYIIGLAANNNASRYAICAGGLIVMDGSFNEIYQDEANCIGMTFSADGNVLYRDSSVNNSPVTQAIDMTTFSIRNTINNFNTSASFATQWGGADSTGMVYGLDPFDASTGGSIVSTTIFEAVDTTTSSTPALSNPGDALQIAHVVGNIGSPQGGDVIALICAGVDDVSASSVSVTIGGTAATNVSVLPMGYIYSQTLANLRLVELTTPSGTPGLADITIHAGGASFTMPQSFQYAQSRTVFKFSSSPTFLLYDSARQKLYASLGSQVEVIDPVEQQTLSPIIPAGAVAASQFSGLSLSPDGNRLYVADSGANLIHIIDLNSPGSTTTINPGTAVGSSLPISPGRVFESASGKIIGSSASGGLLFSIDRTTGSGSWLHDQFGNQIFGEAWNSASAGRYIFLESCGGGLLTDGLVSNCVSLWDDATSQYIYSRDLTQDFEEAAANEDGTDIVVGGSTPGIGDSYPEIVDSNLNTMGLIKNHFDAPLPTGTPSFYLHPSGALLYKAGSFMVSGPNPFADLVEIDDIHQYQPAGIIVFPEPFLTSYAPFTNHYLTSDNTGRYFFGVTQSGISMIELSTLPLSIGNVQPSFGQPSGGENVTIRGSGFEVGAQATIGGAQAQTTFIDEDTLSVIMPALASGYQDVTITNSGGGSYTLPVGFQVIDASAVPTITGFSPTQLAVGPGIGGFDTSLSITIVGTNFAPYDAVEIDGEPIDSAFIDASNIQATIPATFTGKTGLISFTVVSPYSGDSNAMSLPMVNPVPVIDYLSPESIATGSTSTNLGVYGTGFVAGSIIQWNGQNLTTSLNGGETSAGQEVLTAVVPGDLLETTGNPTITVFNPQPGGGLSNTVAESVAPAAPLVNFPASITFGPTLLTTTATQSFELVNLGTGNYTMSSLSTSPGPFTASGTCTNLPPTGLYACAIQIQFAPTAAGAANATLMITDNMAGSPHTIPISGTGTTATAAPNVSISVAQGSNSATVTPGQTATYNITASDGGNGYTGTANITCTGAPVGANCKVSPSTVNIGMTPSPFTVTVTTTGASLAFQNPISGDRFLAATLLFTLAGLMLLQQRTKKALLPWVALIALLACGCGGGSNATSPGAGGSSGTSTSATPAGTYSLTVQATTANNAQTSVLLSLQVQ